MTELQRLLYRELYRKSLYEFVKGFWNTADPSKFVDSKLIQCYCEIFQYMCRDWVGYKELDIKVPAKTDDNEIIENNIRNLALDRDNYFYLPGKILHIDGDDDYLERCMNFYKKNKIKALFVITPQGEA